MASASSSFELFFHLLPLLLLSTMKTTTMAAFEDFTSFVYVGCSQNRYTLGSPYQLNVDSLLTTLVNAATFSSYHDSTSAAASATTPSYGLFQCRADLPVPDCAACVRSALDRLSSLCPSSSGAGVQLKGCFLRYANDSFLGKPDTGLVYKKCGAATASAEVAGMRDAALSALAGGGGMGEYRVGASGRVQALAQCVGDQDGKQCGDCVASAVEQVKDGCGAADAGDVYLGKCYVSYWSTGAYALASPGHYHGDHVSGRTIAIVLAITIAVVVGIIFLSVMRRSGK
ncbi:plasmodesmata-located protein 7-like [Zingiber officinale]|nr:plasmodesmata-located protein 7-like [Zingiber officinale]